MPVCSSCGTENPPEARFCMSCAAPLAAEAEAQAREVRKTVTVLFTDVAGSTPLGERLDPEALRRVMATYFDRMREVVERHGGTVEKFIGDAIMAVFGIPRIHEDDALRAVRAAAEMRQALADLNRELERERGVTIEVRTGINTGEVVAGDPSRGQALVTGDAVNTAARLEQAAGPGEILVGEATHRLVRDAVRVEAVEPLSLKGKAEPVTAVRLLEVLAGVEAVPRRLDSPLVGREREWQLLRLAFDRAVGDRTCHLVTVLGSAGVGKSRLVEEFIRSVEDEVQVLRGRCLPYGEGITFWPVVEAVRAAASIGADEPPGEALEKLRELVGEADRGSLVAERVAQVMGLAADSAVADETFWAIRRLFEVLAARRPLVLIFDDIHWAESTLLDLVEHLADWSRDAPMAVVCLSRQELLDHRPGWGGGKVNATTILLEPLTEAECATLIENLLGRAQLAADARDRIVDAAEGNPLFVEQMLSMLIDDGALQRDDGHWVAVEQISAVQVPPTIQALLAARLDRLGEEEREVIERAAVVGRIFYRGAVSELSPEPMRLAVPGHLMTLVRRELIRPHASEYGEETYRFRHMLIRDAAYEALPKQTRAELHERFAAWLEARVGERLREYEEILGYHLEEAHRYLAELGPLDERGLDLGRRAGSLLGSAGVRAWARGDVHATLNLLQRATSLLSEADPHRLELLPDLAEALLQSARIEETGDLLDQGLRLANAQGNRSVLLRLRLAQMWYAASVGGEHDMHGAVRTVQQVLQEAEATGDSSLQNRAREAAGWFLFWSGRSREAEAVLEGGLAKARGSVADKARLLRGLSPLAIWGHVPAERAFRRWTEIAVEASGEYEAIALGVLGVLSAMRGDFEAARSNLARGEAKLRDLGHALDLAAGHPPALVALMAGDFARAEEITRKGIEALKEAGETGFLSTSAVFMAEALYGQGRYEEAVEATRLSEANTSAGDVASEIGWRVARAKSLARLGDTKEAERLAREAVAIGERTDHVQRASCFEALAIVLAATGRGQEAIDAARRAVEVLDEKGDIVSAGRVRKLLEELSSDG